ncbi:ThiF family adenylyltransferase [Sphingobacterium cellulitidis]|uniref:ThiF family adenylyltransferase n=1 Tax=Sphingobacterium cellulitidis TaxID=1768011 RepID=UPI00370D830B
MEWNSQFQKLVSHNDDLKKLVEKGYAVSIDNNHLVIRDIPYLNEKGELKIGAIVSKLNFISPLKVTQVDHQVFFSGSHPYELNGNPIGNFGGGPISIYLLAEDFKVERSFSNKPLSTGAFKDHFEKIENYVSLISGPAIEKFPEQTPYTFRQVESFGDTIFKFNNTLTSRAEIGDLATRFNDDVVAIIGLGGTGSYILDFLVKTPVREIRGFDYDKYHIHNAYRSPGALTVDELDKSKAEVYFNRYKNFREGIKMVPSFIVAGSEAELDGVTFAFVSIDKGSARAEIHQLLINLKIPFIDVGMGLNRDKGTIGGLVRTTYFPVENAHRVVEKKLVPIADYEDDIYKSNIQISELNALNASMAVLKFKQVRGFYNDDSQYYYTLFDLTDSKNIGENEF